MIRLEMGYPDFDSQVNILRDRQTVNPIDQIQEIIRGEEILAMQEEVRGIHVKDTILNLSLIHICIVFCAAGRFWPYSARQSHGR